MRWERGATTPTCYTDGRMDLLFDSLLAGVGLGAGLSVMSGLRAFLPLGLVGLLARYEVLGAFDLEGTTFRVLENPWVIGVLLILAVVEIIGDKIPVLDSALDLVAWPLRAAAGAIVFGAAVAPESPALLAIGMIGGGAIALTTNAVKSMIRPGAAGAGGTGGRSLGPFVSFFEDVTTIIGGMVVLLLPVSGLLFVAFLIFLVYRVRKIKRRKYKGLRILKE